MALRLVHKHAAQLAAAQHAQGRRQARSGLVAGWRGGWQGHVAGHLRLLGAEGFQALAQFGALVARGLRQTGRRWRRLRCQWQTSPLGMPWAFAQWNAASPPLAGGGWPRARPAPARWSGGDHAGQVGSTARPAMMAFRPQACGGFGVANMSSACGGPRPRGPRAMPNCSEFALRAAWCPSRCWNP